MTLSLSDTLIVLVTDLRSYSLIGVVEHLVIRAGPLSSSLLLEYLIRYSIEYLTIIFISGSIPNW